MAEQLKSANQQVQGSSPGGSPSHKFSIVSTSGSPEGDCIELPGGSQDKPGSPGFLLPASGSPYPKGVLRKGIVFNSLVDHLPKNLFRYFGKEITIRVLPSSKTKVIIISALFFDHDWVTVFVSDISLVRSPFISDQLLVIKRNHHIDRVRRNEHHEFTGLH